MLRNTLLLILCSFFCCEIIAQDRYCATPPFSSWWQDEYRKNPGAYERSGGGPVYLPLSIHLVTNQGSAGYYSKGKLLDAVCTLNNDYSETGIQFFIEEIYELQHNAMNGHPTLMDGGNLMLDLNVPNTVNCYVVSDPAGACGYAFMGHGMALSKTCMQGPTWAHEVGHYLSIPHTFVGWEYTSYDYSLPAPDSVLFDFFYYPQGATMPEVLEFHRETELADGSNCATSGDFFCDTPADYLNFRWNCDDNQESGITQHDFYGDSFKSDGTFIMSYATDDCQNRFSVEQGNAMHAYLQSTIPNILYNQNPNTNPITEVPDLMLPAEGASETPNAANFSWSAVPNATHYVLQFSFVPTFTFAINEKIVEGTSVLVDDLNPNTNYYWRVRPYNEGYFCTSTSMVGNFTTSEPTSILNPALDRGLTWNLFPNPATDKLNIQSSKSAEISLFNQVGALVLADEMEQGETNVDISSLSNGVYFVRLKTVAGIQTKRLLILD